MSSSLKYNTKLYFLSTNILEYIISSTDSLNELVNSNDNHVHTILFELCVEVDHHKEESTSRIKADSDDRNAI